MRAHVGLVNLNDYSVAFTDKVSVSYDNTRNKIIIEVCGCECDISEDFVFKNLLKSNRVNVSFKTGARGGGFRPTEIRNCKFVSYKVVSEQGDVVKSNLVLEKSLYRSKFINFLSKFI